MSTYFIAGGAGFIGSHLTKNIINEDRDARVVVYDNFSSGDMRHLEQLKDNERLEIVKGDVKDKDKLTEAMKGAGIVYHFASNPDISKAVTEPDIDFWEGTYLTNNIIEAMRVNSVGKLLYASGSGVYGDTGLLEVGEDYSPKLPTSTYGASKLSGEALICSYSYMFGIDAAAFRFANVVGPNQTHGVGYDFIKKLTDNPDELLILGDGNQSKSYLYITDVIAAIRLVESEYLHEFSYYNAATLDYLTVNEIADITVEVMGLKNVKYNYTGGDRGWKGDVPVVRLNSEKLRKLGWKNKHTAREAIYKSVESMYGDMGTKTKG